MQFKLKDPERFLGKAGTQEDADRFNTVYIQAEGYDATVTTLQQVLALPFVKLCNLEGEHIIDMTTSHFVNCFAHTAGDRLVPVTEYVFKPTADNCAITLNGKVLYLGADYDQCLIVWHGIKLGHVVNGQPCKFLVE